MKDSISDGEDQLGGAGPGVFANENVLHVHGVGKVDEGVDLKKKVHCIDIDASRLACA